jgi:hypothetical protein
MDATGRQVFKIEVLRVYDAVKISKNTALCILLWTSCYKNFEHELRTMQKWSSSMRGLRAPNIVWAGMYNIKETLG